MGLSALFNFPYWPLSKSLILTTSNRGLSAKESHRWTLMSNIRRLLQWASLYTWEISGGWWLLWGNENSLRMASAWEKLHSLRKASEATGHFPVGDAELSCLAHRPTLPRLLPPSLASSLPVTTLHMELPHKNRCFFLLCLCQPVVFTRSALKLWPGEVGPYLRRGKCNWVGCLHHPRCLHHCHQHHLLMQVPDKHLLLSSSASHLLCLVRIHYPHFKKGTMEVIKSEGKKMIEPMFVWFHSTSS